MSSHHRPLAVALPVAVALFLAACTTSGNYRNDAAHKQVLEGLRQCLVDIPISGDKGKDFISPCVGRDVSSLNGITRHRLMSALGPPRYCISQTETSFPEKDECPLAQDPLWSFYRLADSMVMGGGPELVCVSHGQARCASLEWRRSK